MPMSATIHPDDLRQAGFIGLLSAIKTSNCDVKSKQFACYARIRIKGEVIDEIRSWDFLSKVARMSIKNETANSYISSLAGSGDFLDIDNFQIKDGVNPLDSMIEEETIANVNDAAASGCNEQEIMVMRLLYNEGITKREIASRLNVSEGRICQINSRAIEKIKDRLKKNL